MSKIERIAVDWGTRAGIQVPVGELCSIVQLLNYLLSLTTKSSFAQPALFGFDRGRVLSSSSCLVALRFICGRHGETSVPSGYLLLTHPRILQPHTRDLRCGFE